MIVQPTFLLIADIGGYTRFMKMHRMSLAHAQDIVARLLEAVIDATRSRLKLSKLEGDAAFFYLNYPEGTEPALAFVAEQVADKIDSPAQPALPKEREDQNENVQIRRFALRCLSFLG